MDDISDTLAPKSDQLDAVDLLDGPRIFTVERVSAGNSERPVQIHLAEFPRVWRPGVNMRRVLAYCWGKKTGPWIGRRIELYCDANVTFGKEKVGGTRISRLSHIDGPKSAPVINGQKAGTWTVKPLPTAAPTAEPTIDARIKQLQDAWRATDDADRRAQIEAEVAALKAGL